MKERIEPYLDISGYKRFRDARRSTTAKAPASPYNLVIATPGQGAPAPMSWARLLKRVLDIDIERCPNSAAP